MMRVDYAAGVKLAIESYEVALKRREQTDAWAEIGAADLASLTSTRPARVVQAYKKALSGATDQARESVRRQFLMCQRLGILKEISAAVLAELPQLESAAKSTEAVVRVMLFTGHRIDDAGRAVPRFPSTKESQAREMIRAAVHKEVDRTGGRLLGVSGGASGGDILFHEVCEELGIPSEMHLAFPQNEYIKASVADAGGDWVDRFNRLYERLKPKIFSEAIELPRWLRTKKEYGIWQRSNLWMLHSALYLSQDQLTLIALWNGASGDGPGGTEDMVKRAQDRGATFIHLDARRLIE